MLSIEAKDYGRWKQLIPWISELNHECIDINQQQNDQFIPVHLRQVMTLPKHLESVSFPILTSLHLGNLDLSTSESLSYLIAPLLESIYLKSCVNMSLKSLAKCHFPILRRILCFSNSYWHPQFLNRMDTKERFSMTLMAVKDRTIDVEQIMRLDFDIRFAAKFHPKSFGMSLYSYKIKTMIEEPVSIGLMINSKSQYLERQNGFVKYFLTKMPPEKQLIPTFKEID